MTARSRVFLSSRTLPGHGAISSAACAASSTPPMRLSYLALNSSMNAWMRSGISSRRSRSGGQRQADDVQAVVEVFTERPIAEGFLRVLVRGRQHAHVHLDLGPAAEAPDRARLEDAKELGLHRGVHLRDLVEEERALVRELEAAGPALERAGERALLVAEDLALEERLGNGRAVDGDERARARAARARGWSAPPAPCRCRSPP